MADGPASFNRDFTCPDLLRYRTQTRPQASPTGLSPPPVAPSNALRLARTPHPKDLQTPPVRPYNPTGTTAAACHAPRVWAPPLSLAATRGLTCCFLFLRVLRCFSSPGSPRAAYVFSRPMTGHHPGRVPPFGHPGINARLQLPPAFRSLPRPSSPSCAQASTPRPYCLIPLHSNSKRNLLTTPSRHSSQHDPHSSLSKSSPPTRRAGGGLPCMKVVRVT